MSEDKKLIAYCGLYCGDCVNYKGEIANLARDLRKKLRQAKFDRSSKGLSKYFKEFKDYEQCYATLGAMVRLRCSRVCRDGGGPPFCKIRKCCEKKNIQGCWECEELETCTKLDFLKPIHEDAHLKNLRKIKNQGTKVTKKPYTYIEEEAIYENKEAGITLAGTLTLPSGNGPFPAVLLITGSGPQDRNETIYNHSPFLVLADYLTRQDIAVLRVDDRGVGESTGDFSQATSEDFASDVLAGVEYLKTCKEIDPKKIGLIGHSEGGIIAPMVAVKSPDVAFIVLMAGTGLTGEEILYLQGALISRAMGVSEEDIIKNRQFNDKIFSVLKEEEDSEIAEKRLRQMFMEDWEKMSDEKKEQIGDPEVFLKAQLQSLLSPWLKFFLTYDPKPTLSKVKCPVLAINGEKDLQVPPKENLRAIEDALKTGGNQNYTIKELPGLNHLFQTAQTGVPAEYVKIEETISPEVLKIISDWILEQTGDK